MLSVVNARFLARVTTELCIWLAFAFKISIQWRRKVPKVWGEGGHTDTYIYVHSIKNQYNRDVIEYMVIYVMVTEIFHKIIN